MATGRPYYIVFNARTEMISVLAFVDQTGNLGCALGPNKWNLC